MVAVLPLYISMIILFSSLLHSYLEVHFFVIRFALVSSLLLLRKVHSIAHKWTFGLKTDIARHPEYRPGQA